MQHDIPRLPVKRLLALPKELANQITEFRYSRRLPTESAATRALIQLGLAAAQQPQEVQR
jgi:hypothetical protein